MVVFIAILAALTAGGAIHLLLDARTGARRDDTGPSQAVMAYFGRVFAPVFRRRMPDLCERYETKIRLSNAVGMPQDGAWFAGAAFGVGLLASVGTLLFALVAGTGILFGVLLAFFAGATGFVAVVRRLESKLASRTKILDKEFPFFLDFVVMTKQAGAILSDSIAMFVEASGGSLLGREMGTLLSTTAKGPRGLLGALVSYRETCPSETGKTALMAVVAAEPVGAQNTETLSSLAADMRFERKQAGEREAESIKSKIMLPVTVMLVGVILMILSSSLANILFGF